MNGRTPYREIVKLQNQASSKNDSNLLLTGIILGVTVLTFVHYAIESQKISDYISKKYDSKNH